MALEHKVSVILAGHNIFTIDLTVLHCHCSRNNMDFGAMLNDIGVIGAIDSLRIARYICDAGDSNLDKSNLRLGSLYEQMTGSPLTGAHDAMVDVDGNVRLFLEPIFVNYLKESKNIVGRLTEPPIKYIAMMKQQDGSKHSRTVIPTNELLSVTRLR